MIFVVYALACRWQECHLPVGNSSGCFFHNGAISNAFASRCSQSFERHFLMRKNRTSLIVAMSVFAAALLTGNAAFASSYIHQTNTEKGYVTYPEHFKSERTRAEVQAEAAAFVKQGGSDAFRGGNFPPRDTSAASGKTREQVVNEFRSQTPQERKALEALYRG